MQTAKQIQKLLLIVAELKKDHPKKEFTLDGRLLGDIGEVLVEDSYDLTLYTRVNKHYDAETPSGRKVQIKATMKDSLTYPPEHIPDYYLGIKIHDDGSFEEIYNGPGRPIHELISKRKRPKNNLHNLTLTALKKLNQSISQQDRIAKKG